MDKLFIIKVDIRVLIQWLDNSLPSIMLNVELKMDIIL